MQRGYGGLGHVNARIPMPVGGGSTAASPVGSLLQKLLQWSAQGQAPQPAAPQMATGDVLGQMIGLTRDRGNPAADMTGKYNTALQPADEGRFQSWIGDLSKAKNYDARLDLKDYDLRGAFQDAAGTDPRGHMTDRFKKPNHPTFSQGSIYSGTDGNIGGQWSEGRPSGFADRPGRWDFAPSATNLQNLTPAQLQEYFRRVEPGNRLVMPPAPQPMQTAQVRPLESWLGRR